MAMMLAIAALFLALILVSAVQMAADNKVTLTRSIGFEVIGFVVLLPIIGIAKAFLVMKENKKTTACVLVAVAALTGITLILGHFQNKKWEYEASKGHYAMSSVDWKLARLHAKGAKGEPVKYDRMFAGSILVREDKGQVLVFEQSFGNWDRWSVFDVTSEGVAKKVGQRDIASK